nr:GIY-YIG nuclease family protein [Verrucomicrobium sp. BvORR034]
MTLSLSRKQARASSRKKRPAAPASDDADAGLDASASASVATWCLYVLRCADRSLYCGITNDVERRLARHSAGTGARYTRGRGPLVLERSWPADSKSEALKMELRFKKLRKAHKEQAVQAEGRDWAVETKDSRPEVG